MKTTQEVELVWNVEENERQAGQPLARSHPSHFVSIPRTSVNMSILIQDVKFTGEVGVFIVNGLCVGATAVTGGDVGIAVWGDDQTTEEIDGAVAGEELTFKIWDGESEYIVELEQFNDKPAWVLDGLLVGSLVVSENIPVEFGIQSAYPNPFNGTIQLSYGLSEAGQVRLKIYDLGGREVISLIDRELTIGAHSLNWKADGIATGVYFARLEQGGKVATMKLLLVK